MLVAAVIITPLGISSAVPAFTNAGALAAGIGVGFSSSVIPYVLDQLAMQQLRRETYSLFVSLLPATAVVVGVIVLRQIPTPAEVAGVALVILGVGIHQERRSPPDRPRPDRSRPDRLGELLGQLGGVAGVERTG